MNSLTVNLGIAQRDRRWQDRGGWIWEWDSEVKKWAGCFDGEFQEYVEEHDLNDYNNGNSYRPFIEVNEEREWEGPWA